MSIKILKDIYEKIALKILTFCFKNQKKKIDIIYDYIIKCYVDTERAEECFNRTVKKLKILQDYKNNLFKTRIVSFKDV